MLGELNQVLNRCIHDLEQSFVLLHLSLMVNSPVDIVVGKEAHSSVPLIQSMLSYGITLDQLILLLLDLIFKGIAAVFKPCSTGSSSHIAKHHLEGVEE